MLYDSSQHFIKKSTPQCLCTCDQKGRATIKTLLHNKGLKFMYQKLFLDTVV